MDTLGLESTAVSLVIFAVAMYEGVKLASMIGKLPRFWLFFLAAIAFVIARRALLLGAAAFSVTIPGYWLTLDTDGTPIVFSLLLLLFIYDMSKTFQRTAPQRPELPSQEQAELAAPEDV